MKTTTQEMIKAVLEEEDIYTIEALVAKKGSKYLVKWENFPSDQNTWEPRSAIPPFIVKFYEQVNAIESSTNSASGDPSVFHRFSQPLRRPLLGPSPGL